MARNDAAKIILRASIISGAIFLGGCKPESEPAAIFAVKPGLWELTSTETGRLAKRNESRREPKRYCISPEDAKAPSFAVLTDDPSGDTEFEVVVADGRITANTEIDTPDRDFTGIPLTINGTYTANNFAVDVSIRMFGTDFVEHKEGRWISDCPW